jgi:predicted restriction endonuclease
VDNGILLSPNADALFDKHLISYTDDGDLITSSSIDGGDLIRLGIDKFKKLPVADAMKPFLEKHRQKLK